MAKGPTESPTFFGCAKSAILISAIDDISLGGIHFRELENMRDYLHEFRIAVFSGKHQEAETLARSQLALGGESAPWFTELGLLRVAQGNLDEALHLFDQAVAADGSYVPALLNGAIILTDLGFYDEACVRLRAAQSIEERNAVKGNPEGWSTRQAIARQHLSIARTHRQLHHPQAARDELQKSLALADLPESHIELAELAIEEGDCERALAALDAARRLQPRNPELHVLAARCHLLQGNRTEASAALSRAELLDDRSQTGHALRKALDTVPEA